MSPVGSLSGPEGALSKGTAKDEEHSGNSERDAEAQGKLLTKDAQQGNRVLNFP